MSNNWDDHRYFLAIARHRSLTAAARALGVSQPTVSRRLEVIEATFNARLFDRTRQGYELTPVGAELFDTVVRVEEDLADANRKIYGMDQQATGTLRVTCTEFFLNGYLDLHIWDFLRLNPGVELSLICTQSPLSITRGDADVAIRFTENPPDTLIGRKLTSVAYGIYAAAGAGGERFYQLDRTDWDWIGIHDESYNRLLFGARFSSIRFKHYVDSMAAMQSMIRAGLGVTLLPCYIADPDPQLRRLDDNLLIDSKFDMWILYHPEMRSSYRMRLLIDHVSQQITSDVDLFTGHRAQHDSVFDHQALSPS